MKIIEGWIYEYCHADDCHIVISKSKITDKMIMEYIKSIIERGDAYGEYVSFWKKDLIDKWERSKIVSWELFWIMEAEELVKIIDDIFKEYKGKKVKITIDVIEEE